MIWTVVWKPTSRNELANLWMIAPDRNAVTQAAHAIDTLLRTDPETRGVVNFDTVRTLSVPPLAVDFEVVEDYRIVWVLSVWTVD